MHKIIKRKENYETGLYIRDIENKIAYNTDDDKPLNQPNEEILKKAKKNQLLISEEQIKEFEKNKKNNN